MGRLQGLGADLTALDVQRLAEQGNERARAIWQSAGENLGIAIAALINIFNSPLYLLGGGVSAAWDLFSPSMFAEIEKRSLTYRLTRDSTKIARATLGGDAGLYGAASLAMNR
jgi:glucokinase